MGSPRLAGHHFLVTLLPHRLPWVRSVTIFNISHVNVDRSIMRSLPRFIALPLLLGSVIPAFATSADDLPLRTRHPRGYHLVQPQRGISHRLSDYANGYGTNAANSTPVTPITPYGGYVVNQYGYGNYVSGPLGYGGYPAGSGGAEIWRQREHWKCEYAPETC